MKKMKIIPLVFTRVFQVTLVTLISTNCVHARVAQNNITGAISSSILVRHHLAASSRSLDDKIMGDQNSPVTVIVYSSLTCPHCATFHTVILPKFKAQYIDTGKVKLIYRDFPLDPLATVAAMLTRCTSCDEVYFRFLDALFASQVSWIKTNKPRQVLVTLAKLGGMTDMDVERCFSDAALLDGLNSVKSEASSKYGVNAAPSFIINGKTHVGIESYEVLSALVETQLLNLPSTVQ